jgi:hypothetical protein
MEKRRKKNVFVHGKTKEQKTHAHCIRTWKNAQTQHTPIFIQSPGVRAGTKKKSGILWSADTEGGGKGVGCRV